MLTCMLTTHRLVVRGGPRDHDDETDDLQQVEVLGARSHSEEPDHACTQRVTASPCYLEFRTWYSLLACAQ